MITSLVLEWFNWGLHCGDDLSRARTKVYRNGYRIVYEAFNGRDEVLHKQEGRFTKENGERFFRITEDRNVQIAKALDYSVEVCDGSCWKMRIRHSDKRMQKLSGTTEYPPYGELIERELRRLCAEAGICDPQLFGCSEPCSTVDTEQPVTTKRDELLRLLVDQNLTMDELLDVVEPLVGKTVAEKERISIQILQERNSE